MLSVAIVFLVLGLIGANILRKHLRETKLLRLREISHKERMAAMERELPLPQTDDSLDEALIEEPPTPRITSTQLAKVSVLWVRLAALGIGLAGIFGGAGTCLGMSLASDPEISGMWAMGLIPAFIGVGLLGFYLMSSGFVASLERATSD